MSRAARSVVAAAVAALAVAAPASASQVLEYEHGRLVPYDDPYLAPPAGPEAAVDGTGQPCGARPKAVSPPARAPVRAAGPSVKQAIDSARRRGQISADDAARYSSDYSAARKARSRLGGRDRRELSSVVGTLEGIAGRGLLTGSRMPALFLQLERNTQFWSGHPTFPPRTDVLPEPCTAPPGVSGSRITFPGSKLVFQYYVGQGIQLQPLANFGAANGMASECMQPNPKRCDLPGLKQYIDELVALRSQRGGFTTWEYWFYFSGGIPPWTSGLSQGTAIQALARASVLFGDKSYLKIAHDALGAFETPPPVGVRVSADGGSHYLIYSFAPGERVLNAFLQSITGLYDYWQISHDSTAKALFHRGDRAARREIGRFDTGAWSLYDQGGAEASLGYHRLVTTFLGNLCNRLHTRAYCGPRKRFLRYLHTPPHVAYTGARKGKAGHALVLGYRLNKVSCVTAEVTDASGKTVYHAKLKVPRGAHSFTWVPRSHGTFTLTLTAEDLNRNKRPLSVPIAVK